MTDSSREEFHSQRRKGIGSSDAPVLMGVSPWKTLRELYEEKISTEIKDQDNWAMQRGRELEPVARDIYEIEIGVIMPPGLKKHKRFNYFLANVDGYNEEKQYGIEIKCPGRADLALADEGIIPTKYIPQIQWQMLVTGAKFWHYVSYDGKAKIKIINVEQNLSYQKQLIARARVFWMHIRHKIVIDSFYETTKRSHDGHDV